MVVVVVVVVVVVEGGGRGDSEIPVSFIKSSLFISLMTH